jgi:broad specificity phosphatase PhoE
MVDAYWRRSDPGYVDGPGAESFAHFMQRVAAFDARLRGIAAGLVVVVGHGQFFAAYRFALAHGFAADATWMRRYRASETAAPQRNGEIVKLRVDQRASYAQ